MKCEFCGDKYDAFTEYCDCSAKLKKLYAHAVVDVVVLADSFRALTSEMFRGKTLVDTVALHKFIESRERKAWRAARVPCKCEDVLCDHPSMSFDEYLESEEYSGT